VSGFDGKDWTTYILKMFCGVKSFAICCKDCHDVKSKEETRLRALYKRLVKSGENTEEVEEGFRNLVDSYRRKS